MRGAAVACLLAFSIPFLAGCTAPEATEPTEIVVKSQPVDVRSDETDAPEAVVDDREPGQIIGVVVDAAIRPLPNARVRIPGLDLLDDADRQGVFSFPDLVPSVYFVVAEAPGYRKAETTVEVGQGEIVRIRFVLDAIPPPAPRHVTKAFKGFADFSGADVFGFSWCGGCRFPFEADPAASVYVIEAVMDPYEWTGTAAGNNSFRVSLYGDQTGTVLSSEGPNPFITDVRNDMLGNHTHFQLSVTPNAFPMPESSKEFQVFVTTWYYSEPPAGWSFVAGSE